MSGRDLLGLVLSNLRRMKTRVVMTAIGVVIGTAAVVVLISLGSGLQRTATEDLGSAGDMAGVYQRDRSRPGPGAVRRQAEKGRPREGTGLESSLSRNHGTAGKTKNGWSSWPRRNRLR